MGYTNYEQMKQFVHNTVNEFDIGPDNTQVGLISYSHNVQLQFYLNTYHNKTNLIAAIDNLLFSSGGTATWEAIDFLRDQGFTPANGGRSHSLAVPRVAVIITDGYSNYALTSSAAAQAHSEGIILFSVGIGTNYNLNELNAIASDPSYISTLTGFETSQLDALQITITAAACTGE